jgi:hypothetical protein
LHDRGADTEIANGLQNSHERSGHSHDPVVRRTQESYEDQRTGPTQRLDGPLGRAGPS